MALREGLVTDNELHPFNPAGINLKTLRARASQDPQWNNFLKPEDRVAPNNRLAAYRKFISQPAAREKPIFTTLERYEFLSRKLGRKSTLFNLLVQEELKNAGLRIAEKPSFEQYVKNLCQEKIQSMLQGIQKCLTSGGVIKDVVAQFLTDKEKNPLLCWYVDNCQTVLQDQLSKVRTVLIQQIENFTKLPLFTAPYFTDDPNEMPALGAAWDFLTAAPGLELWGEKLFQNQDLIALYDIYFGQSHNFFEKTGQKIQGAQADGSYQQAVGLISKINELKIAENTSGVQINMRIKQVENFSNQYINQLIDTVFEPNFKQNQNADEVFKELKRINTEGYLMRISEENKTVTPDELTNCILEKIEKRGKKLEKSLYLNLCSLLEKYALKNTSPFYPSFIAAALNYTNSSKTIEAALKKLEAQKLEAQQNSVDHNVTIYLQQMPDDALGDVPDARWFEAMNGGLYTSRGEEDMTISNLTNKALPYVKSLISQAFQGNTAALQAFGEMSERGYFIQVRKREENKGEEQIEEPIIESIVGSQTILKLCASALVSLNNLPEKEACTWVLFLFDKDNPSFLGLLWSNRLMEIIFTYASDNTELLKAAHDFTIEHFAGNPFDKIQELQKLNEYLDLLNKYPLETRSTLFSGGEKAQPASQWIKVYDSYVEKSKQSTANPHYLIRVNFIRHHFCSIDEQRQIKDVELAESAIDALISALNSGSRLDDVIAKQMKLGFSFAPPQQQAFLKFIRKECKDKSKITKLEELFKAEVFKVSDAWNKVADEGMPPSVLTLLDNLRILRSFMDKPREYILLGKIFQDHFGNTTLLLRRLLFSTMEPLWNYRRFKQFIDTAEFLWRLRHLDKDHAINQGKIDQAIEEEIEEVIKEAKNFLEQRLHPLLLENEEKCACSTQRFMVCWFFVDAYLKSITKEGAPYGGEAPTEKETEERIDLQNKKNAFDSFSRRYVAAHPDSSRVDSWLDLQGDQVNRSHVLINYAEESLVVRCVNRWRAYLLACPSVLLENPSSKMDALLNALPGILLDILKLPEPEEALSAFNSALTRQLKELEGPNSINLDIEEDILTKAFTHLKAQGPNNVIAEMQSEIRFLYGYLRNKLAVTSVEKLSGLAEKQDYVCDLVRHGSLPEAIIELQALLQGYDYLAQIDVTAIKQQLKDLQNSVVLQQWLNGNLEKLSENKSPKTTSMTYVGSLPEVFYLDGGFQKRARELIASKKIPEELCKRITTLISLAETEDFGRKGENSLSELSMEVKAIQKALDNFFIKKGMIDLLKKQLKDLINIEGLEYKDFEVIWQEQIPLEFKSDNLLRMIIIIPKTERETQEKTTQPEQASLPVKVKTPKAKKQQNWFDKLNENAQLQATQTLALFILLNQLKISDDLSPQLSDIIDQIEDQIEEQTQACYPDNSDYDFVGNASNVASLSDSIRKLIEIKKTLGEVVNSLTKTNETKEALVEADSLSLQCPSLWRATLKLQTLLANLADPQKNLDPADFEISWSKLRLRIIDQLRALSQMDMFLQKSKSVIESLKNLFGIFEGNLLPQAPVVLSAKLQVAEIKQQLEDLEKSALLFEWLRTVILMTHTFFSGISIKGFDVSCLRTFSLLVQDLVKVSTFNAELLKVFYLSEGQKEVLEKLLKELSNKAGKGKVYKDLLSRLQLTIVSGKIFGATSTQEQETIHDYVPQIKELLNNSFNHILLHQAEQLLDDQIKKCFPSQWPKNYLTIVQIISNQLGQAEETRGKIIVEQLEYLKFELIWNTIKNNQSKWEKEINNFDQWLADRKNTDEKLLITQTLYLFAQLKCLKDHVNDDKVNLSQRFFEFISNLGNQIVELQSKGWEQEGAGNRKQYYDVLVSIQGVFEKIINSTCIRQEKSEAKVPHRLLADRYPSSIFHEGPGEELPDAVSFGVGLSVGESPILNISLRRRS